MGGIANAVSESLMQLPICTALHQFSMHYQKNTSYLEIATLPLPLPSAASSLSASALCTVRHHRNKTLIFRVVLLSGLELSHQVFLCFQPLRDEYHVSILTLRRLMSYIYGAPILDVSRSHTTTQHSR